MSWWGYQQTGHSQEKYQWASTETSESEMQRENEWKKKKNSGITKNFWEISRGMPYVYWNTRRRRKREWNRRNIWRNNDWECSKIWDKYQITDPESSENVNKHQQSIPGHIIFKLQKKKKKRVRENKEITAADGCGKNITY